jgi:malate dehydrogenase (oxaloacetate-decarboxylating)(NADP+)
MFYAAAKTLAREVTEASLSRGLLFPPLAEIRRVSAAIAAEVARVAYEEGLATLPRPADLATHVAANMYDAAYPVYA